MSLAIDIDEISHVLLTDGWHEVQNESFTMDSYEYGRPITTGRREGEFDLYHGGGQYGICANGFSFKDAATNDWIQGPLTSIIAIRRARP